MLREDGKNVDIETVINDAVYDEGYNLVTCGDCGAGFLHVKHKEGDLKCPHCGYEDDQSSFPDMFY